MSPPDRPLRLGELLAETIRIYGERPRAALGLGAVVAGAFLLAQILPTLLEALVVSISFTAVYGGAARVVSGDSFPEALAQVGLRARVLVVLTVVVSVPFAIANSVPLLLIPGVLWLALTGFSIPVAMLEREQGTSGVLGRIAYALDRSLRLARTEYLHAAGIIAALVIGYFVFGVLIGGALVGFADNGAVVAGALVRLALGPVFFLALAVLYYEQRARAAVSSRPEAA